MSGDEHDVWTSQNQNEGREKRGTGCRRVNPTHCNYTLVYPDIACSICKAGTLNVFRSWQAAQSSTPLNNPERGNLGWVSSDCNRNTCKMTSSQPSQEVYKLCTFGDNLADRHDRWFRIDLGTHRKWAIHSFEIHTPAGKHIRTMCSRHWLTEDGYVVWVANRLTNKSGSKQDGARVCYQDKPPVKHEDCDGHISQHCYTTLVGRYIVLASLKPTDQSCLALCDFIAFGTLVKRVLEHNEMGCDHFYLMKKCCILICFGNRTEDPNFVDMEKAEYLHCNLGLKCYNNICKYDFDNICNSDSDCYPGLSVCHFNVCVLNTNASCEDIDRYHHCKEKHVCSTDGKCKLDVGEPCSQNSWGPYSCAAGLVCDAALWCRRVNGAQCKTHFECQVGAKCINEKCVCDYAVAHDETRADGKHCVPKPGYLYATCDAANPCREETECRNYVSWFNVKKCICTFYFGRDDRNLVCVLKYGTPCSSNPDCGGSLTVCEEGICRAVLGGSCRDNPRICTIGTFCDNDQCKLGYGATCVSSAQCSSRTTCHATEKKCYIKANEECKGNQNCSSNPYKCNVGLNSSSCKLPPGSSCAGPEQSDQCWQSSRCEDVGHSKKCYIKLGSDCKDYRNDCIPPLICSLDKCRLPYDADCTGEMATMCAQGLACSSLEKKCYVDKNSPCLPNKKCIDNNVCNAASGMCKLIPGGNCRHPYDPADCPTNYTCLSGKCSIGLNETCEGEKAHHCQYVCDVDKTCKIAEGFPCTGNNENNCMQGFSCVEGQCTRQRGISEFCDGQRPCAPGTVCDFAFKRCTKPPGGSCIPKDLCPTGFICYTSVNGGKCKLHSDVPCAGRAEHCPDGTQCEAVRSTCKIPVGGSCQVLPWECSRTTSCDIADKICRLTENQNCSGHNTNNCLQSLICDINNLCKLKLGSSCNPQGNACAAGLECDRTHRRCYKAANQKCTEGETCANEYECDSSHRCKLGNRQSCAGERANHCKWGTTCDTDSVCKVSVGNSCSGDFNNSCRSGLKCDNAELCRLELEANCENNEDHCEVPSHCDSGSGYYCKLGLSKPCTPGDGDKCAYSLKCDSESLVCRTLPTGYCTDDFSCSSGYFCEQGVGSSQCKLYHGGNCAMKADHCPFSDICSKDQRCMIRAGYDCRNHRELCIEGAVCSKTTNTCLQNYGGDCSPEKGEHVAGGCISGTVCDEIHKKCYISPYKDCSGNKICAGYYFCDTSRSPPKCRIAVGQSCVRMLQGCPAKTICDTDGLCRLVRFEDCSMFHRYCALGLQCDLIATRKCLTAFNMACQVDGDCVSWLACDHLGVCRIKTNGTCKPHLDQCVAGAKCVSKGNRYVCECESSFSDEVRKLACKPRIGRASAVCGQGGKYCSDKNAQCINDTCVCNAELVYDGNDFTCKRDFGSSCLLDDLIQCRRGLICSRRGKCDLDVGSSCSEHTSCTSSAVCDGGICKVALNHRCDGPHPVTPEIDATSCATGLVCDLITKLCKRCVDSPCNKYLEESIEPDCVTGAECTSSNGTCACISGLFTNSGNICVPVKGHVGGQCRADGTCDGMSQCKNGKCDCPTGFEAHVHTNACKLTVGSTCSREDMKTACTAGSICDIDDKCKWDVGQMCASGSNDCKSKALCDTDEVCRLDVNEDCQDDPFGCRLGTTCTSEGTCKRPSGASCNTTTDCALGAQCTHSICQCNSDFSYIKEDKCLPVKGRVGATCSERLNQCADPTTMECKFSICVCKQGMMLDGGTFGCFKNDSSVSLKGENGNTAIIVLTFVSACLILLAGILIYTKQAGWWSAGPKITPT